MFTPTVFIASELGEAIASHSFIICKSMAKFESDTFFCFQDIIFLIQAQVKARSRMHNESDRRRCVEPMKDEADKRMDQTEKGMHSAKQLCDSGDNKT